MVNGLLLKGESITNRTFVPPWCQPMKISHKTKNDFWISNFRFDGFMNAMNLCNGHETFHAPDKRVEVIPGHPFRYQPSIPMGAIWSLDKSAVTNRPRQGLILSIGSGARPLGSTDTSPFVRYTYVRINQGDQCPNIYKTHIGPTASYSGDTGSNKMKAISKICILDC